MPDTLTDYEIEALQSPGVANLADGHASQEMPFPLVEVTRTLTTLWDECSTIPLPELEETFRTSFARLARSAGMASLSGFKICPTASISADIIAAVLQDKGLLTRLIEPAFDNLALLLRRRGVVLDSVDEHLLHAAVADERIDSFLDSLPCDALYLVHPNNPTGKVIQPQALQIIAEYCATRRIVLILDNSFRLYNRDCFDDYSVLTESGVSFLAFEDTGKVFPTKELKASLLFSSPDMVDIVTAVYNEILLCSSPYSIYLLTRIIDRTTEHGLEKTIWAQVDERRKLLRESLTDTDLEVEISTLETYMPVEWLNTTKTGMNDLQLTGQLAGAGVRVLPGRHFYWNSSAEPKHGYNIRMALMKPMMSFLRACECLRGREWGAKK